MMIPSTNPFKEMRQRAGLTQLEMVYRCRQLEPATKLRPDMISSFESGQKALPGAEQELLAKVLGFQSVSALLSASQASSGEKKASFCPKQFKRLLEERGFTSAPEFARILGCNQSSVSNWLSGRCKPNAVYEAPILRALQVKREQLWIEAEATANTTALGPRSLSPKLQRALSQALRGAKLKVRTNDDWSRFAKSLIRALNKKELPKG